MSLRAFTARTALEPFAFGRSDCALWCADAVQACVGFDPAADFRGTYSDWQGCRALVMRAGGLLNLIAPRMIDPRLRPLGRDGVAVLRAEARTLCGVILDGDALVKTDTGLRRIEAPQIVAGWSW
ncbi:DUF6950 family protein [Ponticoccus alexandrii]|uniref:DUF6950 domain-containing protein n=1 Tax=Ponticoccus alexandrii TaxID=1943633 RepID=A0ABX7FAJ6_9RHOB|nr:hypothetical protein [Ponticoccus alexandrii]QRF66387.1 hypothetical protein GQA70_08730 [Ponticoccus alexandrii]